MHTELGAAAVSTSAVLQGKVPSCVTDTGQLPRYDASPFIYLTIVDKFFAYIAFSVYKSGFSNSEKNAIF